MFFIYKKDYYKWILSDKYIAKKYAENIWDFIYQKHIN